MVLFRVEIPTKKVHTLSRYAASDLRFGGVSQFDVTALWMYFSYANVCHATVTRHDIHQHLYSTISLHRLSQVCSKIQRLTTSKLTIYSVVSLTLNMSSYAHIHIGLHKYIRLVDGLSVANHLQD